jgi:hypothetical protein
MNKPANKPKIIPTIEQQKALTTAMNPSEWGWVTADARFRNALMDDLDLAVQLASDILRREVQLPVPSELASV